MGRRQKKNVPGSFCTKLRVLLVAPCGLDPPFFEIWFHGGVAYFLFLCRIARRFFFLLWVLIFCLFRFLPEGILELPPSLPGYGGEIDAFGSGSNNRKIVPERGPDVSSSVNTHSGFCYKM